MSRAVAVALTAAEIDALLSVVGYAEVGPEWSEANDGRTVAALDRAARKLRQARIQTVARPVLSESESG